MIVPKGKEGKILEFFEPGQLPVEFGGELKVEQYWPPLDTFSKVKDRVSEDEMLDGKLRPFYVIDEFDSQIFGDQIKNAFFEKK